MRPPMRGGGRGGGRDFGGRGGGRDGGRGGFGGRGGGRGFQDFGPPDSVVEAGQFAHACEGEAVVKLTNEKIPYFNADIYLENKTKIGKVEEIFGAINNSFFTIKMSDGVIATSYSAGDKFYIDPYKLLPLDRFLPKPVGAKGAGGGRGAGGRGPPRGGGSFGRGPPRGGGSFGRGPPRGGGSFGRGPPRGGASFGRGPPRGGGRGGRS